MVELASLCAFLWLGGWAGWALTRLARGDRRSIHFVIVVHFMFCGLPLGQDLAFGTPMFEYEPNFFRVVNDPDTTLVYCAYMSLVPCIWLGLEAVGSRGATSPGIPRPQEGTVAGESAGWVQMPMIAVMFLPVCLLPFAPDLAVCIEYASSVRTVLTQAEADFRGKMGVACLAAVVASSLLLTVVKRIQPGHLVLCAAAIGQAVWLHGKRSICAIAIMGLFYALWRRGILRGTRFAMACALCAAAMVGITVAYQAAVRGHGVDDIAHYYDGVRVDFARDAVIRQAIHAELYADQRPILEYRGQSFLFDLTFYIPRDVWPDKPWPYAIYATSAMLGFGETRELGWGVTTSILDEAIANLGWSGILVGPLLISCICFLGDRSGNPLAAVLTVIVANLILVVQLSAFLAIFLFWAGVVAWARYQEWGRRCVRSECSVGKGGCA